MNRRGRPGGNCGPGNRWTQEWRKQWKGAPPPWEMRPGSQAQAWRGFGRKILVVFLIMFFCFGFVAWLFVRLVTSVVLHPSGLLATAIVAVLLIVLLIRSGVRTLRPVRRLIDAAGRLADGDYSVRVAPSGSGSSRRVVRSFNDMARRLEEADEQRRRLLADLGHELRTPLTVVRGELEAIVDGVHDADPDHLEALLDEVAVMERLLEDLRTLSMAEAGALELHVEPIDLATLVTDTVESHRRTSEARGVALSVDAVDVGEMLIDPVRIREVISNLVVNALRAMPEGGGLRVTVGLDGDQAVIRIRDTGSGIEPDDLDRVFERFAKGSTSAGSGLGLTISRDLVEAHGGLITISSEPGIGTTVEVRLPRRHVA
jgi:signal transduction histidine kinase